MLLAKGAVIGRDQALGSLQREVRKRRPGPDAAARV
jgi:hypothetical protein